MFELENKIKVVTEIVPSMRILALDDEAIPSMRDVSKHSINEGLGLDMLNELIGTIAEEVEKQEEQAPEEDDEFDDLIVADEEMA